MIILCLNCRGLGQTQAVKDLRALIRRFSHRVVFLSETERSKLEMEEITKVLGDFYSVFVEARERVGGMALLCNKRTDLTVMSCSSHHIDSTIKWHTHDPPW